MTVHTIARHEDRPWLETMMRVIPPDPRKPSEVFTITLRDPPSLAELRDIVGPHIGTKAIERVRVFTYFLAEGFERYLDLFVDESGARKHLKRNPIATAIYRNNHLKHGPKGVEPEALPAVYGTAVLFRDEVWS